MFRWENLGTDIQKGSENATRNYHTIDWTPKRSFELSELYSTSSVGMQCQAGGGEQLPGDWTNLNVPHIADDEEEKNQSTKQEKYLPLRNQGQQ